MQIVRRFVTRLQQNIPPYVSGVFILYFPSHSNKISGPANEGPLIIKIYISLTV